MNIQNRFLPGLFLLTSLYAISAPSDPFIIQQSDGAEIPVKMFGHEYYNWIETLDGYVIQRVDEGENPGWFYAELNENGKNSPSVYIVSYPAPQNLPIRRMPKF